MSRQKVVRRWWFWCRSHCGDGRSQWSEELRGHSVGGLKNEQEENGGSVGQLVLRSLLKRGTLVGLLRLSV